MSTSSVGQGLVNVTGCVDSPEVRCDSELVKTVDQKIGRSEERGVSNARVQSQRGHVEPRVCVIEDLFEVVHSSERLADKPRRNDSVIDKREIVHSTWGDLIVVRNHRACISGLRTGAAEVAERDVIPFVEDVINLYNAVIAV